MHRAAGTYRPLAWLLEADGYRVLPHRGRFEPAGLARCRILIISNASGAPRYRIYGLNLPIPTTAKREDPAFTRDEVALLVRWARAGGSLLLAADHFPLGKASAPLAQALGVSMSGGFTEASNREPASRDPSQLVYSHANGLLADHPIIAGRSAAERVRRVVTFTGQSLASRRGTQLLRLPDDAMNHLPSEGEPVSFSAKGESQGLALEVGKGRVVVLGEAAAITAQLGEGGAFGFQRGNDNERFALNIVHWLTHLL